MSKSQSIFIYGLNIKDERGKLKNCQLCGIKFSLSNKEHQCKRCKRAVCEKCSMTKALVQKADGTSKKPHRQCNFCKDEYDQIKKFLDQYKITFNKDSFSQQWLQAFGSDTGKAKNDFLNAQEDAEQQKDTNQYDIFKAKLEVVINDIDGFVNYSIKDFMVNAMKNIESFRQKEVVKNSILKVVGTLLKLYPQIGYSHELVLITYFLLFFSSEASAYVLLSIIYAHIIPSQLYPKVANKYDLINEQSIIIGVLKDALKIDQVDTNVLKSFLQQKLKYYIVTLSINLFLFETTFFIINSIFTSGNKAYMDLLANMSVLLAVSNQEIQKNKYNHEETELYMLRQIRTNQLNVLYKQTQNCDLESYKKVYITTRSDSIKIDNLSVSTRTSLIQPDLQKISDINQKLQEQLDKKDQEIKQLNLELLQQREKMKQLQKEININQNKQDNTNELEIQKIKVHELKLENSELKSQLEQLKNQNSKLKLQIDDLKEQNSKQSIVQPKQQDDLESFEKDLEDMKLLKLKLEQQARKQGQNKQIQNQQQIDEIKENYEKQIKQLQKQLQEQNYDNSDEINDLKRENQILKIKIDKMREDKNKNDLLQQKIDEIELLTELNEELTKENQKLLYQLRDLKSQSGTSSAQQIKVFEEQIKMQEQQLFQYKQIIKDLGTKLSQVQINKQNQLEFADMKIKIKDDVEDMKMVAEIRTVQNQILKGLLKDSQSQLGLYIEVIQQSRMILEKTKQL